MKPALMLPCSNAQLAVIHALLDSRRIAERIPEMERDAFVAFMLELEDRTDSRWQIPQALKLYSAYKRAQQEHLTEEQAQHE